MELAKRDTLLLASDGLSDNLHMSEIFAMMRRGQLAGNLDDIVKLAQARMMRQSQHAPGKADDLSVVMFRKP